MEYGNRFGQRSRVATMRGPPEEPMRKAFCRSLAAVQTWQERRR